MSTDSSIRNPDHPLLAQANAEEGARQRFVLALKGHLGRTLRPRMHEVYQQQALPRWQAEQGRSPETEQEVAEALYAEPRYQYWSALARAAQEHMWLAVAAPIERQRESLQSQCESLRQSARGSLTLNPEVAPPRVLREVDIHLQPGGYLRDEGPQDIMAGALYEAGGNLYSQGEGVGTRESKADCAMRFLREWAPDFTPRRILDLACSAGASTVPYALAFPDAEVHAVDLGPGLLRYAHARAEALGATVHFHQADATATPFDDGSFDLVVSHNAMHEMSPETQQALFAESHRLLAPGGVCLHQDVPLRLADFDTFSRVLYRWDEFFNGEPCWSAYGNNDCEALLEAAGFDPEHSHTGLFAMLDNSFSWYFAAGRKGAASCNGTASQKSTARQQGAAA